VSRQEFDELKALVAKLAVKCENYDELVGKLQSDLVTVQEKNTKLQDRIN
jgi:hypothetical protein